MNKAIYISIKPEHVRNIELGIKNYEFRNYLPKKSFTHLYIYESSPTCKLRYIIEVGNIVEKPNKIDNKGIKNDLFNDGNLTKYAYQIKKLSKIDEISLKDLKDKYNFIPPQAFAYDTKYPKLSEFLEKKYKL